MGNLESLAKKGAARPPVCTQEPQNDPDAPFAWYEKEANGLH